MQGMQGCPMCGMMGDQQLQPQLAQHPNEIRRQIQNLQQRLDELEQGQTTPQQAIQQMPAMCPMCQGMMAEMGPTPSKSELEEQMQQQVQPLERRVKVLEHSRR